MRLELGSGRSSNWFANSHKNGTGHFGKLHVKMPLSESARNSWRTRRGRQPLALCANSWIPEWPNSNLS